MSLVDAEMTRDVLRDIGRHPIDVSNLDVLVMHGVVYLRGRIGSIRGFYDDLDLHKELDMIIKALRQKPGVRDITVEVEFGEASLKERLSPHVRRTNY